MNRLSLFAYFAFFAVEISGFGAEFAAKEVPYVTVSNPPPVQMLVPGFVARQLPLDLNNINNLVYAPDGRLFALCYDGNVLQLKDTDGDGLEDTATHFFKNDHNELPPTIGMCWGPGGLYLPIKNKVVRLRDKGDGTAEMETITSDWAPPFKFGGSSLDAVGIAVDAKGNVYFGLGCDDWSAAYRVNKQTGESDYDIHSERGTILKVPAGSTNREIICTGMRWPGALAFNAAGDLFCADQEGATWLPNGNPFDELLHIQKGRHYGFPPRHPKYLPNVIDEPSVFDYAPQHESTCGLHFNEGQKLFGPRWWRGDAIVAGESRGKIWRTKLVKSAAGYVAQNNLIGCVSMLTIDAVPTPDGGLVLTCHSGKPDWGTGPKGKGKLFKISYADTDTPQPVLAYAATPTATRVIFDRPLDLKQLKNLASRSRITFGKYVTAGDRFESFRPGYKVVEMQMKEARFELPILNALVSSDARSITLQTAPRSAALNYALTLPKPRPTGTASPLTPALSPLRGEGVSLDVLTDLTGVEATWRDSSGQEQWSGWLPHLDLQVARELTAANAEHKRLFDLVTKPGTLILRAQLDLWQMLHPVVQIGSKLDYEYPPETVMLDIDAGAAFSVSGDSTGKAHRARLDKARLTFEPKESQWSPIHLELKTGSARPRLDISWHTAEDARARALPLRRMFLPFARPAGTDSPVSQESPEIAGGNWQSGKKLFFSEQLACFKCHQIGGEGGKIGPDLSNLMQRDYASVMKDITQPSAALNPDHLAYNIEMKDGEIVNGVIVKDDAEKLSLGLANGTTSDIPKSKIANLQPSAISLMPENLLQSLNAQQRKDLMTFLLTSPAESNHHEIHEIHEKGK